jgi:Zn-dependent protease with chaperone function
MVGIRANSNRWACAARRLTSCVAAVLLLAAQLAAVTGGPSFPDPGNPGMSHADQISLGRQAAAEVYQQMPVLPDSSPETQYVRKLGEKLVATIPSQYSWPFEFHVIPQKEINAFALPGGPMFVNVGTITAASDEAELAGVMAHEMAHVYMQHSAKQAGKAQWTSTLFGLAGAILGSTIGGVGGQLAQMGVQFGAGTIIMKYSRDDEAQADAVGAIILYKAGYNPQAMADFFQTLAGEGGQPPQWLSDHPNPGNREQAIESEIQGWPPKNYQTNSAAFRSAKARATSVKVYTAEEIAQGAKSGRWATLNKQNGVVPAGLPAPTNSAASTTASAAPPARSVLPSQQTRNADLGPLRLDHPVNWEITMPQQQGDYVTIAPQAGITQSGVGYGVLIGSAAPPSGQRMSLDEITRTLVDQMQQKNNLRAVSNTQSISINGIRGRSLALESTSPFVTANGEQQPERDWLVTIPRPDSSIVYFIFVAPQTEFDRFRPAFENMLRSVQF